MSLFAKYEADPATVRAAGDEAVAQDASFRSAGDLAVQRAQRAASETSGLLPAETSEVANPVQAEAYSLGAAALLVGGCLRTFADSIDTYNQGVAGLNTRWDEAVASDFGVASDAGAEPDMTDAERQTAHSGAVSAAREALRTELTGLEKDLKTELDESGDDAASNLGKGPNAETLSYYGMAGALPVSALGAHLSLSTAELQKLVDFGKQAIKMGTVGKRAREIFHMIAQTDLKEAAKLIDEDWNRLLQRSTWTGANPLKTWIQDHSDFMTRSAAAMDDAADARLMRLSNMIYDGSKLSKISGPLAIVGGGLQIYDTIANWDEMSVKDRTLNLAGGGTSVVAGLGTAAMMAGFAIPVAGQVALVGVGLVSAGIAIYQNWDTITDVAGDLANGVKDFVTDPGQALSDAGDAIEDGLDKVGDGLKGAAEGVGDFFGF
ncbi:hypothetical protein [Solicola sp. PLA-1-18]|uniref:hypothetical protein n=1 Tax=Solicola sp. PLA-1-18 TaxID=3380532 RepID=UPI003B825C4D